MLARPLDSNNKDTNSTCELQHNKQYKSQWNQLHKRPKQGDIGNIKAIGLHTDEHTYDKKENNEPSDRTKRKTLRDKRKQEQRNEHNGEDTHTQHTMDNNDDDKGGYYKKAKNDGDMNGEDNNNEDEVNSNDDNKKGDDTATVEQACRSEQHSSKRKRWDIVLRTRRSKSKTGDG